MSRVGRENIVGISDGRLDDEYDVNSNIIFVCKKKKYTSRGCTYQDKPIGTLSNEL